MSSDKSNRGLPRKTFPGLSAPMRKLISNVAVAVLSVQCLWGGDAVAEDFTHDLRMIRKSNRSASIDASEIAGRYIKIGASQQWVEHYLSSQGFVLHKRSEAEGEAMTLLAIRSEKQAALTGFGDEVRVVVTLSKGHVVGVSCKLLYRAL